MKKMLFIYNPYAGTGALKPKISDVLDIFTKGGYEVTVYPTQKAHDAVEKIQSFRGEYDLLVCSGGDGTLDEAVTGIQLRGTDIPLGYIPAGTTNDFASSLGISKDILAAADTAVNGVPFSCDVGLFNGDPFIYIAAFGLFTDVSYETKQSMKNILGHLAYVLEGTKRIFNIPSYKIKVTHDGEEFEDEFIFGMVTNSRSVGGFKGMPTQPVELDDGIFEVVLVRQPQNPIQLQAIIRALLTMSPDEGGLVTSYRTGRLKITCDRALPWTLDGEFGGDHAAAEIENCRRAVTIVYGA